MIDVIERIMNNVTNIEEYLFQIQNVNKCAISIFMQRIVPLI